MTLGLSCIMKDEVEDLKRIIKDYSQYFDKIFITCTHYPTFLKLQEQNLPIHLSYFKWQDNFGKAREFNRQLVDSDYFFWCDMDDGIIGAENLKAAVEFMEQNNIDITYMVYDYYQDEEGNPTNTHDRERIIRTKANVKWSDVPVHETCENPNLRNAKISSIYVKHRMTPDELESATKRNTELLKKHWRQKKDPRTAYYLGLSYGIAEEWDKSIKMFKYSLEKGWPEQQADVWNRLAEVYYRKGDYDNALKATDEVLKIQPEDPVPYYQKVAIYMNSDLAKAIEWGKVAVTKPPLETMFPVDPTLVTHRGPYMVAQCCEAVGATDAAEEIYKHIRSIAPKFYSTMNRERQKEKQSGHNNNLRKYTR